MTYLERLYKLEQEAIATYEYYQAKYEQDDTYDVACAEAFNDLREIQECIFFAQQDEY